MTKQTYEDTYKILNTTKNQTERGSTYFHIEAVDLLTGQIVQCTYFGNTTPKRLLEVITKETESGTYNIAVIQPHTSRDKRTGRFTSFRRT